MKVSRNCYGIFIVNTEWLKCPCSYSRRLPAPVCIFTRVPESRDVRLFSTHVKVDGSTPDLFHIFSVFVFEYSRQGQHQQSNIATEMLLSREQIGATGRVVAIYHMYFKPNEWKCLSRAPNTFPSLLSFPIKVTGPLCTRSEGEPSVVVLTISVCGFNGMSHLLRFSVSETV
jgi:hypothetical protein